MPANGSAASASCTGKGRRLRLIFVAPFAPDLAGSHGGARATGAIIDMLARRHEVVVLYPAAPGAAASRQPPQGTRKFSGVAVPAVSRSVRGPLARVFNAAKLLTWSRPDWAVETFSAEMKAAVEREVRAFSPDVVHFEYHVMSQYIATAKRAAPHVACLVTEHEPGIVAEAFANISLSLSRRLGIFARRRAWRRFESQMLSRADAIIAFTDRDAAVVKRLVGKPGPPVACIPFRLPLPACDDMCAPSPIASDLLFVGNFDHPPNVDAAMWLLERIFPKIQSVLPSAKLCVVGGNPPAPLLEAVRDGVTVTGWVEDAMPYLTGASVVVAPLRQGGGLRVKVIEACARKKALVATTCATAGLSLRDGVEFVLADDEDAIAKSVIELLSNPARRRQIERAARSWAEQTQSPERWAHDYEALYCKLGLGGLQSSSSGSD